MQQEREMMRRVKLRDSMRGAMASNSMLAISMQISVLIETAMKDSCALLNFVSEKALDLHDRQVCGRGHTAHFFAHSAFLRTIFSVILIACSTWSSEEASEFQPQLSPRYQLLLQSLRKSQVSSELPVWSNEPADLTAPLQPKLKRCGCLRKKNSILKLHFRTQLS
jgi:hypothetical protein